MHAAGDYELRMAFTPLPRVDEPNEPPEGAAGGVGYPPPAR